MSRYSLVLRSLQWPVRGVPLASPQAHDESIVLQENRLSNDIINLENLFRYNRIRKINHLPQSRKHRRQTVVLNSASPSGPTIVFSSGANRVLPQPNRLQRLLGLKIWQRDGLLISGVY